MSAPTTTSLADHLFGHLSEVLHRVENNTEREVSVTLTPNDVHLATSHGLLRRYEKLLGRRGDRVQKEDSSWGNEMDGVCAEFAWCKYLGLFWTGVSGLRAKDGGGMEVRWTEHDHGGLIVYPHDNDDSVYVLAKGQTPHFRFVGWLTGREAKRMADRKDFGMLVHPSKLRGMDQ